MANSVATGEGEPVVVAAPAAPVVAPVVEGSTGQPAPALANTFTDSLPEDLRGVETLKKFKDLPGLAKSYVEFEKHVGGTLKVPTEKSDAAEWNAFYSKLGRPEKPDGYTIEEPKDLPPGVTWNSEVVKAFAARAHTAGYSNAQVKAALDFHTELVKEQAKSFWTQERGIATLETELKSKEAATEVVVNVQRGIKQLADPDFREFLDTTGAGNNPAVLKFLSKVGKLFKEDVVPEHQAPAGGGVSVDEARSAIASIRNDKTHAYHKGDPAATAHMNKLYEVVFGKKTVLEVK